MNSIFFDLETTDLNPVGQILNYAFVEVDEKWNIRSSLKGTVKVSRLQLPSPYAIAATKIDIIEHNKTADDEEHIALAKIQKYVQDIIEWKDTRLVGFNSNKFDVPYIRTSMIRNGLNPYFNGSVKYGDVLHVVKKLACENQDFANKLEQKNNRPVFKLESVTKALGLLDSSEVQAHESMSDVLLTIKLAKFLAETYNLDVRTYNSYEAPSSKVSVVKIFPYRNESGELVSDDYCYMAIHEQNKSQALWINLKKFDEGLQRDSISWFNKNTSSMFVREVVTDVDMLAKAEEASAALKHIKLANFFPERNCDVESFIFMMPINDISALYDAVWRKDLFLIKERKCKLASQLYLRFLSKTLDVQEVETQLLDYALYRYGGRMKTNKDDVTSKYEAGVYNESFHATYNELLKQIDDIAQKTPENVYIMSQLKKFYEQSVITTIAGAELKKINRVVV